MIYIISLPMNNCTGRVGSLGRINTGQRRVAPDVARPQRCWATIKFTALSPPICTPAGEMLGGGHTERKTHRSSAPLRPLKTGLNQCLRPGLKFPSPPCAESPEHGRVAWAPTKPKRSQAGPGKRLLSASAPSLFLHPR